MNREIKFRALSRATGMSVFGLPQYTSGGEIGLICGWLGDEGFEQYKTIEVIPNSISQFTGLKDKNGKEIYEGDIISTVKNKNGVDLKRPSIGFEDASYVVVDNKYNFEYLNFYESDTEIEIIGNIHENPELL